jgi:polysaccharide biosynthesis transport protein
MLQADSNHFAPYREPEPAASEPAASIPELISSVLGFIRRRLLTVILTFVAVTAVGEPIVLKLVQAKFIATSTVFIDNRKYQMFQHQSMVGDTSIDSYAMESQIEILKSENIALAVIRKLRLAEDSEFGSPKPGLIGTILGSSEIASNFARERRALGVLASQLTARRIGPTYVIEISFKSSNAERAAMVANAIADAYINDQLEGKYEATRRAGDWLRDRLKELSDQATASQRNVIEFKAANNIVEADNGRTLNEQQVAEFGAQLIAVRQRAADAKARLARIEELIGANVDGAAVDAAVTDSVKTEVFTKLRTQYLERENREREWSARYGHDHLASVNLRNQMREIRSAIRDELKRVAETYKSEYELAKEYEDRLQRELDLATSQTKTTNEARVRLRELESAAQSYRSLYDNFLQRYMESVQQQSFPITEARLITKATPPASKDYRKTFLGLAAVPIGGLVFGFGLAFFRELMDDVFRTERQIQATLGTKCVAIVPMWKESEQWPDRSWTDVGSAGPRRIVRDRTPLWSVSDAPFSYFAESVRSIKAAADLFGAGNAVKVIGFTSTVANEGKSTIAAGLAQVITQAGSSVILVDCDLRNPSLSSSLAPGAEFGLVDVISGKVALNDVIWTDPTTTIAFLPAVMKSRLAQTNEVLASDTTRKLFDTLRLLYDYVVVDLSPLGPVVDVRATANLVDAYVFVVEWGRTHTNVVRRTLMAAPSVADSLLGVVLNKTDLKLLGRYDTHISKYYQTGYYKSGAAGETNRGTVTSQRQWSRWLAGRWLALWGGKPRHGCDRGKSENQV